MRHVFLALAASCACAPLLAQTASPTVAERPKVPFVKAEAEEAVRALAAALEQNFVFPDVGKAYAAKLRQRLAAGDYANFGDGYAFADTVTADLQAVHKDGHLKLRPVPPARPQGASGAPGAPGGAGGPPPGSAITRSGWLAKGVAYVDFRGFPGNDETVADLKRFLADHKDAKTLIIDARGHHGGGLAEMDLMFPQLFAKPTVLVAMDTRHVTDGKEPPPTTSPRYARSRPPTASFATNMWLLPPPSRPVCGMPKSICWCRTRRCRPASISHCRSSGPGARL